MNTENSYKTEIEKINERAETQIRAINEEKEVRGLLEAAGLPQPWIYYSHSGEIGYRLAEHDTPTREAVVTLLTQLWPYQIDACMWKPEGFRAYFKDTPYRSDAVRGNDVSLFMTTSAHESRGYTRQCGKLEFYIKLGSRVVGVQIDLGNGFGRIESNHIRAGKTIKSQIREHVYRYYGLDTGMIPRYEMRGYAAQHGADFAEHWSGIDAGDLEDILITHANKY